MGRGVACDLSEWSYFQRRDYIKLCWLHRTIVGLRLRRQRGAIGSGVRQSIQLSMSQLTLVLLAITRRLDDRRLESLLSTAAADWVGVVFH